MRQAQITRQTKETDIALTLALDGTGACEVDTGCGFLDHMLEALGRHALVDLRVTCQGDTRVDDHHTVEDVGIVLGKAFAAALGDKQGIRRYGTAFVPMDEALAMVSLDISGRPYLAYEVSLSSQKVGTFDTELAEEFLRAFAVHAGVTIHVKLLSGRNTHHILEAVFKALGRTLDEASRLDERIRGVLSTKGTL